jgi:hypothetical protein
MTSITPPHLSKYELVNLYSTVVELITHSTDGYIFGEKITNPNPYSAAVELILARKVPAVVKREIPQVSEPEYLDVRTMSFDETILIDTKNFVDDNSLGERKDGINIEILFNPYE